MQQTARDPRKRPSVSAGVNEQLKRSVTSSGRESSTLRPSSVPASSTALRREPYASAYGRREPPRDVDTVARFPSHESLVSPLRQSTTSVYVPNSRASVPVEGVNTNNEAGLHLSGSEATSPERERLSHTRASVEVDDVQRPSQIEELLQGLTSKITHIIQWDFRLCSADAAVSRAQQRLALLDDEGGDRREIEACQTHLKEEKSKWALAADRISRAKSDLRRVTRELTIVLAADVSPSVAAAPASVPDETQTLLQSMNQRMDAQDKKISSLEADNKRLVTKYDDTLRSLQNARDQEREIMERGREAKVLELSHDYMELKGETGIWRSQQEANKQKFAEFSKRLNELAKQIARKSDVFDEVCLEFQRYLQQDRQGIEEKVGKKGAESNDKLKSTRGHLEHYQGNNLPNGTGGSSSDNTDLHATHGHLARTLEELHQKVSKLETLMRDLSNGEAVDQLKEDLLAVRATLLGSGADDAAGTSLVAKLERLQAGHDTLRKLCTEISEAQVEHIGTQQGPPPIQSSQFKAAMEEMEHLKPRLVAVERKIVGPFTMEMLATALEEANQTSSAIDADVQAKHKVIEQHIEGEVAKLAAAAEGLLKSNHVTDDDLRSVKVRLGVLETTIMNNPPRPERLDQTAPRQSNGGLPTNRPSTDSEMPPDNQSTRTAAAASPRQSAQMRWTAPTTPTKYFSSAVAAVNGGVPLQAIPSLNITSQRASQQQAPYSPQSIVSNVLQYFNPTFTDISKRLASTEHSLASMQPRLSNSIDALQSLEQRYQNIMTDDLARKILAQLSNRLPREHDVLTRDLSALRLDVVELYARLQRQDVSRTQLASDYETLDAKVKALGELSKDVDLEKSVHAVKDSVTNICAKVKCLEEGKTSVDNAIDIINATHADNVSAIISNTNELSDVKDALLELAELKAVIMKFEPAAMGKKFEQIRAAMTEVRTRLEDLEEIGNLDGKLENEIENITFLIRNVEQLRSEAGLPKVDFVNRSWHKPDLTNETHRSRKRRKRVLSSSDTD